MDVFVAPVIGRYKWMRRMMDEATGATSGHLASYGGATCRIVTALLECPTVDNSVTSGTPADISDYSIVSRLLGHSSTLINLSPENIT